MKLLAKSLLLITLSFLLVQCGNGGSTGATNKYLGELPGIAGGFKAQLDELEEEKDNASDLEDAFKLQSEYDEADEKAEQAFKDEAAKLSMPISIPFEGAVDTEEYKVTEAKITGAVFNQIIINVKVVPKVTRQHLFAYLRMLDESGKNLGGEKDWGVLAVSNFRNVKEGEPIELTGIYRGVEKLENLEKFGFGTKDEWSSKH